MDEYSCFRICTCLVEQQLVEDELILWVVRRLLRDLNPANHACPVVKRVRRQEAMQYIIGTVIIFWCNIWSFPDRRKSLSKFTNFHASLPNAVIPLHKLRKNSL